MYKYIYIYIYIYLCVYIYTCTTSFSCAPRLVYSHLFNVNLKIILLQRVAVCCRVLQCVVVCCSVFQCVLHLKFKL